jgi:2-haloacid dehalogenase
MSQERRRSIRWLTFDVLGTCVDWRSSLSEEGAREWNILGLQSAIDWNSFALTWVEDYALGIQAANTPGPWLPADRVIRNGLEEALASYGVSTVSASDKDALCRLWDRLRPWSDAAHGWKESDRADAWWRLFQTLV